jgi:hypothetical protein
MDAMIWVCDERGLSPFTNGDGVCALDVAFDLVLNGEAELVSIMGSRGASEKTILAFRAKVARWF